MSEFGFMANSMNRRDVEAQSVPDLYLRLSEHLSPKVRAHTQGYADGNLLRPP
jgi:hypothetical protein